MTSDVGTVAMFQHMRNVLSVLHPPIVLNLSSGEYSDTVIVTLSKLLFFFAATQSFSFLNKSHPN
jgi:uncharacterized membrane protein YqaE (UPF0057 family)